MRGAACVVAYAFFCVIAVGQETDRLIDTTLANSRVLLKSGSAARNPLKREIARHRDIRYVLQEIRRIVRGRRPVEPVAASEITAAASRLAAAASTLASRGEVIVPLVTARRRSLKDDRMKSILDALVLGVRVSQARALLRPMLKKGRFAGMFAGLSARRSELLGAFLIIFEDHDSPVRERVLAATALAELADPRDETVNKALRGVYATVGEEADARQAAVQALARLGDSGPLEKTADIVRRRIAEAMSRDEPPALAIAEDHRILASLYQGALMFRQTARHYLAAMDIIWRIDFEKTAPKVRALLRGKVASDSYNLACAASRLGFHDLALWALEQHFLWGGTLGRWALRDGDLASLRDADGRMKRLVGVFESGERRPAAIAPPRDDAAMKRWFRRLAVDRQKTGTKSKLVSDKECP